jgi:4-hydroxybenzoate polyprenyltransferase
MARSHHRKKHKHFQPPPHEKKTKSGAASLMAIVGAVVGLAIMYFANQENIILMAVGLVAGGLIGYIVGRSIDKGGSKK